MYKENIHPIERIMDNAITKMKAIADADLIIGQTIMTTDGGSIIPVSKVSVGLVTGGGEYGEGEEFPFASGCGAGATLTPIGFLVSDGKSVKFTPATDKNTLDRALDVLPDVIESAIKGLKK